MEFKQLEAFVAVVDYGSFSEAARKLYLTQPTISTHIRSLEEELHTRLIIRTTKKLTITPKGYQLYDSAVRMLDIRNNLFETLPVRRNRSLIWRLPPSLLPIFSQNLWQVSAECIRMYISTPGRQTVPELSAVFWTEA